MENESDNTQYINFHTIDIDERRSLLDRIEFKLNEKNCWMKGEEGIGDGVVNALCDEAFLGYYGRHCWD